MLCPENGCFENHRIMQMSHLLSFQISWLLTHKQTERRLPNINPIIDSSKYIMKIVRCRQRKTIKVRKNWKISCQFYKTLACLHLKCPENTIKIDDIETLNNLKNSTHETTQWKQVIEMPAMTGGGVKKAVFRINLLLFTQKWLVNVKFSLLDHFGRFMFLLHFDGTVVFIFSVCKHVWYDQRWSVVASGKKNPDSSADWISSSYVEFFQARVAGYLVMKI